MLKTEIIEDAKGLGGFALYVLVALVALIFGEQILFMRLIVGLVLVFTVVILIRAFYFKNRPRPEKFNTFIGKIDASSFPSMHAMRATVLFTILAAQFMNFWLAFIGFIAILCVSSARVIGERHFITDVLGGIIIGLIISWLSFALIL